MCGFVACLFLKKLRHTSPLFFGYDPKHFIRRFKITTHHSRLVFQRSVERSKVGDDI